MKNNTKEKHITFDGFNHLVYYSMARVNLMGGDNDFFIRHMVNDLLCRMYEKNKLTPTIINIINHDCSEKQLEKLLRIRVSEMTVDEMIRENERYTSMHQIKQVFTSENINLSADIGSTTLKKACLDISYHNNVDKIFAQKMRVSFNNLSLQAKIYKQIAFQIINQEISKKLAQSGRQ